MWRAKQTLWCYIKTEDISVSTHISINRNKYRCECIHTYSCIRLLALSGDSPIAMSTPTFQLSVYKHHSPILHLK